MSLTLTRLCDERPPISSRPAAPPRSRPTTPPKSQFPRQPHTACRPAAPHANRNSPPHQHPSSVRVPNPPPTGTKGRQTLFHRANPSRHWRILPANKPSTVQNLHPQSQNLHSLEQSGPKPASHRPDSSTRWKNLPAERSAGVRIPPEDGRILPRKAPLEAKIPQSLEQNGH